MPRTSRDDEAVHVARRSFVCRVGGKRRVVRVGEMVRGGDPVYAGREALFEPLEDALPPIEQATAAPGERRATRRAKPKPPEEVTPE